MKMTPITLLLLCLTPGLSRGHPGPQNQAPEVSPQSERMTPISLILLCLTSGLSRGHPGPQNQAPEVR
jgi:hypothetical protein